ncbi:hypothetical protein [Sedimentibacter sp.]|uniref:hypothetical protein n=1 Tax=Sedimentibacter sp. TaxID=1960295 RepID=UPI0028AF9FA1|nr:hypothetical protein [Sedimentibacter sp.]
MNHTIAKIRQKGTGFKYRKILTGETLYTLPDDLTNHVEYSPTHNLDEDCWFGIEDFSQKEYCLDILQKDFVSAEYSTCLRHEEADRIDFIFSYQDDNAYYFQNITKSQLQYNRRYINLGDRFTFTSNSRDIAINSIPDAIYINNVDILYFKKLSSISKIFVGIDTLYREATQEETVEFLENEFISLQEGFSAENVKQANRKRIAMAVDAINSFDDAQRTIVFDCIRDYCLT